MSSNALNKIIYLIKAGDKTTARELLQVLVESEPDNVNAWLWYAETFATDQERLKVLQQCLVRNPADVRTQQAAKILKQRLVAQLQATAAPTSDPIQSSSTVEADLGRTPPALPPHPVRPRGNPARIPRYVWLSGGLALLLLVFIFIGYPALIRQYFTDLDLEPLLIQAGDLPAGLSGGQIRYYTPDPGSNPKWADPVRIIEQEITASGRGIGRVMVQLFDSNAKVNTIANDFATFPHLQPINVGERGFVDVQTFDTVNLYATFFRCKAVVVIDMTNSRLDQLKAYAQRLDERLGPLACW